MSDLRALMTQRGFYRFPLKKTKSNHYKLSLHVNGVKGSFILDTGASSSCMSFDAVEPFKLHPEETDMKATGAGASNIDMQITQNNTLHCGGWRKNGVPIIVMNMSHVNQGLLELEEAPVDGILGADLLKSARAVIDYGRNCIYVK